MRIIRKDGKLGTDSKEAVLLENGEKLGLDAASLVKGVGYVAIEG